MAIDRRALLAGLAALPFTARADERRAALFACGRDDDGDAVFALDANGESLWRRAMPGRGHGLALAHGRDVVFVAARRPGRWLMRIDLRLGAATIWPCDDLDYGGHAVDLGDGRLALTASDADGRGCVVVLDAGDGRRIATWDTGGVDPHELILVDGTLIVANGGDPVEPSSLVRLDPESGAILERRETAEDLRRLSLRHLAILPGGAVTVVAQDRGPADPAVPLLARWRGGDLDWIDLGRVQRELRGYCGAVASRGERLCLTSPHGGLALELPGASAHRLPDVCGVAALGGGFALSGGRGDLVLADGRQLRHKIAWDNHLASV
jgi:hypothetical protein